MQFTLRVGFPVIFTVVTPDNCVEELLCNYICG